MGRRLSFVLALAAVLQDPVLSQQCPLGSPSQTLQFADGGAEQRVLALRRLPGYLDPLYGLVQSFLDVVQPNPFPTELLRDALNEPPAASPSQVLQYQAGYIACAAIAVVYFVAVPLAGLSICCCRRRRRCGGRLKAYRRSLLCRCHVLMACLFLTTLVILGGAIFAFAANQKVKEAVEPGTRDALNTLQALRHHLSGVRRGVQQTVQQFAVPKEQVLSDLNNVGRSIGTIIHFVLKGSVYSALAALKGRVQDLQDTKHHLQTIGRTVQTLMQRQAELEAALRARKPSITALLGDPRCTYCASAASRAQGLEPEANFRKVPSVEGVWKTLQGLPRADFADMIYQANRSFNSVPELTVVKMAEVVRALKEEVENAAQKVQSIADSFPVTDHTRPLAEALAKAENGSRPYLKEVAHYERCRWIAAVIACTVLLLIVCCNLLGLVCGAYGLAVRDDPSDYDGRGEAGAKLLITGVCFSFLFSWLLMLLVFGTFITGGNVRTVLCKPWASQEVYQFIDTPGNLPPSMNISWRLGLKEDLNVTTAYQQCKNGAGLWEVLQLEGSYSLNEHLKVEKYTAAFQKRVRDFNMHFEDIVLLNADAKKDLETFRDSQVDLIDYAAFTAQLHKSVVRTNMDGLALDLERLSNLQSDRSVKEQLADEAQKLRRIQNMTVLKMKELVVKLRESVHFLSTKAPSFQVLLKGLQLGSAILIKASPFCAALNRSESQIGLVKASFSVQTQRILRQELDCFMKKEVGYISQYLNWVRSTVTEDVASCQPVSTALDSARVILCDRIVDPWNAFWFSLGSCTFFLIPSIFFSIKTVQHFRPVRHRLISTGSEETCPFHIPRVTSLRL
ncbi:prominin-2 [Varanus komodoensis]|uniref:prominin-2 n=1 Tax=Varanus komodoensis TaxID=61221 RepID=UPI001CF76D3A|nr:prominin-2 [Varanus komodoensis]